MIPGFAAAYVKSSTTSSPSFQDIYASRFDGVPTTGNYLNGGQPADFVGKNWSTNQMTVIGWIRPLSTTIDGTIFSVATQSNRPVFMGLINNLPFFYIGSNYMGGGASPVTSGTYSYLAMAVRAGGTAVCRLNNTSLGGTTAGTDVTALDMLIGGRRSSGNTGLDINANCLIDDVAIFNTGLSDAELNEAYNSGKPMNLFNHSKSANLIHWWQMGDGGDTTQVTDRVGTAHMTFQGSFSNANFTTTVP